MTLPGLSEHARIAGILDFWFGAPDDPARRAPRAHWFEKDAGFDRECERRFADLVERALAGELDDWEDTPEGALALTILLDQLPRNLFRGSPRSYAGDPRAHAVATRAIERGFDRKVSSVERWFFYLPFEHGETLEDQRRAVELFRTLEPDPEKQPLRSVLAHQRIIERFGRFPHRNTVLGRESTPEELEFLSGPDSSF